ncbi:LIM domain and actin binding 1, partial [Coemansia erecta]
VTHKRLTDGGLELRIHALPVRPRKAAPETLAGGGNAGGGNASDGAASPVPSRIRATSSFASAPSSRPLTRISEYMRSRPLSSHQSFMEIRPAFDDGSVSDSECMHSNGARTPQSLERSASPMLVGGGSSGGAQLEPRNRSASMTQVEDKCTMTTLRGLPDELRAHTPEKVASQVDSGSEAESDHELGSRNSSPALSVLRGGGCTAVRPSGSTDVFSAFNGPPVAPPDRHAGSGRSHQQLRPRRTSKDKVNYRERVESLLTQYFPAEVLDKYLDELRHRYRFMGSGGMTPGDITKLLDETTADTKLKEQLRASLEELAMTPASETSLSDSEHTATSTPSQRHYLSIRETELRNVLDRTSVSPAPKAPRFPPATSSNLVGGGVSMEDLPSPNTMRSYRTNDHTSEAASVMPAESVRNASLSSKPRTMSMPIPEQAALSDVDETAASEHSHSQPASKPASPEPAAAVTPEPRKAPLPRSQPATPQPERQSMPRQPPNSDGPRRGSPQMPNSEYWEDNDKFKVRPPDMARAFKVLKSKPIFIRELSNTDIDFKSPFSRYYQAPAPDARSPSSARHAAGSAASRTSKFSERHPTESKVAKAVSELEEVLRRTEAETVASIENDFESPAASSARGSARSAATGRRPPSNAESVLSRDSLVGGGASSRSTSAATRISALDAKYGARPESASKLSASQSTIRTDILMKEGVEYGDADRIDEDEEDEAVVPVKHEVNNESSVTLPMPIDDMPAELAAVLRRTGGLDDSKLRRTSTPSQASRASHRSAATRATESRISKTPSLAAASLARSEHASVRSTATAPRPEQASVRSTATAARSDHSSSSRVSKIASVKSEAPANRSLTELDIVMGRTGGAVSRSAVSSRASAASVKAEELHGGSGSPVKPTASPAPALVTNDSENELASVLRRTSGYAPSATSSYASSQASESRPESVASELKSVYPPEALRPASGIGSQRTGRGYAPGLREQAASPLRKSAASPSPARSAVRTPAASGPAASGYTPSPLRKPAYQPSERQAPSAASRRPPPQQSSPSPANGDDDERSEAPPSPMPYRLPTPIFGRFPSPPRHIKERAKAQAEAEEEAQRQQELKEQEQQQQQPPPQARRELSRNRAHSQSASQDEPIPANRQYMEDPVVDRLDLETGSLASRRSRPRNTSAFGSASTLMSGQNRDTYDLPKVVEEDIDSLASYPSSVRADTPVLVGGGRLHPSDFESQAPTTLRGGGRLHPAFMNETDAPAKPACDAGCCGVCGEGVNKTDVVVRPQVMHASCLRCEACDCLLTTSTFRAIDGHVYCEKDYQRFFIGKDASPRSPTSKVVSVNPSISDEKFQAMNRAIMESFTSVDDFLLHMRQLRDKNGPQPGAETDSSTFTGDPSQVQRAGDVGVDRQTHYEREQVTSPSGTPWITERVVDKKVKTKVLEKRYPADGSVPPSLKSRAPEPVKAVESTLMGGGAGGRPQSNASRMDAMRANNPSSASRPSTSLLNDTKDISGWEHPLCPVCSSVVYPNDRVVHEGYGYHKSCMRCQRCSQVTPVASAVRIKGAIYCKKHGTELLRRRSILMRKKSTMGRRSRHNRSRGGVSSDRFAADAASEAAPPVPQMPMFGGAEKAQSRTASRDAQPRLVTTALRNFLEAAAEQIESQTFAPITPEPQPQRDMSPPRTRASDAPPAKRPLPVPKAKAKAKQMQVQVPPPQPAPRSVISHISSPPPSPNAMSRSSSRSIFSGSRDSLYDPNVVNALRQEAQRQINSSQPSMPASPSRGLDRNAQRLLSPCGPSIADALQKFSSGNNGRMSVSSEFDPFESQDPLTNSFVSPQQQQQQPAAFSPNAQLDNLERRF